MYWVIYTDGELADAGTLKARLRRKVKLFTSYKKATTWAQKQHKRIKLIDIAQSVE